MLAWRSAKYEKRIFFSSYYVLLYHFQFSHVRTNSCLLRARFDFTYWQSYDDNGERASLNVGEWRGLSLPGTARAIALGMRVRTMSFPSIKGPCFHPARSGDRSFGLVSNAGAMTLPHFSFSLSSCKLQFIRFSRPIRRVYRRRDASWRSLVQSTAAATTAQEWAQRGSDLIALKIETVLKEDMPDLPWLSMSMADSIFWYAVQIYALTLC